MGDIEPGVGGRVPWRQLAKAHYVSTHWRTFYRRVFVNSITHGITTCSGLYILRTLVCDTQYSHENRVLDVEMSTWFVDATIPCTL